MHTKSQQQDSPIDPISRPKEDPRERILHRGDRKSLRRINPQISSRRDQQFTGETNDLKDRIYDIGYSQADTYTRITKKIAEYCGRKYNNEVDVKKSIEELTPLVLDLPADQVESDNW